MSHRISPPLILASLSLLWTPALYAVDWNFGNSFTSRLVYTDNVSLNQDSDEDIVLELRPRVSADRQGRRVQFRGSYNPSLIQRFDSSQSEIVHNLSANGTTELYENVFFVDFRAQAGLTSVSSGSTLGADGINNDSNTTQTYSVSLSPYTRHRLGSYADITTRLSLDTLQFDEDGASDSDSGTLSVTVQSGSEFANLPWSLNFQTNTVGFDNNEDTRNSVTGSVQIPAHRSFTYTASVGYENNDLQTSRGDTDGVTWTVGGIWTPNPRTNGKVSYGQRYFGDNWSAALSHRTRKTTLSATYSQEVTNVRNTIINLQDAFLFNPLTGQIIPVQIPIAELIEEDFLSKSVSLGVAVAGLRTTVSVRTGWSNRVFEVTGNEQETYDASASLNRRIGPNLSGNLQLAWESLDNMSANSERTTYRISGGVSRTLGRNSSISFDISHRSTDDDASGDTEENRVSATFTTQVL